MPAAKALREQRAALLPRIRELADREPQWTEEDRANWEAVNTEYNAVTRSIETAERLEGIEAELARSTAPPAAPGQEDRSAPPADRADDAEPTAPTEEDRALALQAWCLRQARRPLTPRHLAATERCGLDPARPELALQLNRNYNTIRREARAMSATTGNAGGYTVPQGFVPQLEAAMLAFGGVRQVAEILRTDSGNAMPWPTANDTGNTGELIAENYTIGSSVDPTIGAMTLNAYKFSSKLVLVPVELLEDSAFDVAAVLGQMLGERLGRVMNTYFTTGSGTAQPNGIVTAATLGKTTASATALTTDELLDLVHSVDPAYRGPGCGWMFHDSLMLVLRKLKDGESRYIFQPSMNDGAPDRLLGYPVTINQDMAASLTATYKTLLFGQLSKYKVREVAQVRLRRLVERYADTDQEGYVAFLRADGDLLDAGTHPVKYLQQHA